MIKIGEQAPEFELFATPDQKISLSELSGRNVVLVFYPADWSPVCSDELTIFNQAHKLFDKYNATVLGISVDSRWCHMSFAKDRNYHFPLLADFHPKGAVSKLFDVYDEVEGESKRAIILIDTNKKINWTYLSPTAINPGVDGILEALENLTNEKS